MHFPTFNFFSKLAVPLVLSSENDCYLLIRKEQLSHMWDCLETCEDKIIKAAVKRQYIRRWWICNTLIQGWVGRCRWPRSKTWSRVRNSGDLEATAWVE